jgi:hypothetical protein
VGNSSRNPTSSCAARCAVGRAVRRTHPNGHMIPGPTQKPTDTAGNDDDRDFADGVWMTKAQLAALRRISVASADRLIRRQGWRKHPGNDGRARVLVPRTWAEPRHNGPTDQPQAKPTDKSDRPTDGLTVSPTDTLPDPTDKTLVISVLQAAVEAQSKRADRAEAEAERQAERAALAEEQREQSLADLRVELERRAEDAARMQTVLEGAAADLRAERSRAERAEAGREGERGRADTLRDRLDEAQAQLQRAREAADQAQQHARGAEDAIGALRQADAARRGRGRWARLRAAWRGE